MAKTSKSKFKKLTSSTKAFAAIRNCVISYWKQYGSDITKWPSPTGNRRGPFCHGTVKLVICSICQVAVIMSDQSARTVVVAIDDSETALHAFQWTLSNFYKKDSDHLRLIHVQPFHEVTDVIASAEMAVPVYSAGKVREESIAIAKKFAHLCKDAGIQNFKEDIILEDGSSGAAICEYIENLPQASSDDITLILGSRELGFFKRAFIGSTSEYCVRNSHCPVLVVKMPYKKNQ